MKDNIINFNNEKRERKVFEKLGEFLSENEITPLELQNFIFENEAHMIFGFYEEMKIDNSEEKVYELLDKIVELSQKIGEFIVGDAVELSQKFLVPPSQILLLASNMLVDNLFEEELKFGQELDDIEFDSSIADDIESQLKFDFFNDSKDD